MTKSTQRIPVGTVLTGRHGYVLRPEELGVTVPPESRFAKQPTLGFTLFADEFEEVDKCLPNCTTARTRCGDVLFAVVVAETKSFLHIGVMDVSHPGSHHAVMESSKNRAINFGVTDGMGEMRLVCLGVEDAFAAVIERMTGPIELTPHLKLLQAFGHIVKDTADGSLLERLGWGDSKKRASAHLLVPEANRPPAGFAVPAASIAGILH